MAAVVTVKYQWEIPDSNRTHRHFRCTRWDCIRFSTCPAHGNKCIPL